MEHIGKFKKLWVYVLSFAMILACMAPGSITAAKQPKLNKSASAYAGDTLTLKLKNVSKKAKVKWKSKSKKIARITKQTKKSAKIKAVKAGKTKITVKYVLGKSKKTLSCKLTVRDKETVPEGTATTAPSPTAPAATDTPNVTETPVVTEEPSMEWVSTWGTAEENFTASADRMPQPLNDTTVRQIIKVTTSGKEFKLRLSNQYGKSDVTIHSLHIAKQGPDADKSTIDTATDTVVTVGGEEEFVIPAGQVIETDGVKFAVNALENVAVSAYFGDAPEAATEMTGHRGARATTYQVSGNSVSEETLASPTTTTAWYFLADASVMSPAGSKAVVCFGDSITDGYGTDADYLQRKPDSYTRWGDYFAKRLQANEKTKNISVINEGIGSNGMLGSWPTDAGKDRFARDLLEHDGVGYCIILFGVNDLKQLKDTSKYNQLLPEYQKMVELCHENGIKVYGAPILPFGTSTGKDGYYSEESEQVRTMINDWMRSEESGMDGIIDFDKAVADPDDPKSLLEKYTSMENGDGHDGLHPYAGYDVMADAIDLTLFE